MAGWRARMPRTSKISAEDMGNEEEAMPKIEARYLRRLSAVYERQSTLAQVEGNENSRLYQESQKEVAHRYGWPENRIIAIDEISGSVGRALAARGTNGCCG